jgi:hypothetical protein
LGPEKRAIQGEITEQGRKDIDAALAELEIVARNLGMLESRSNFPADDAQRSTVAQVRSAITGWLVNINPAVLQVVQSLRDLPPHVQNALIAAKKPVRQVQGFILDGRAYMVADNIRVGAELAVFMHEVGAHIGLTAEEESAAAARIRAWAQHDAGSRERHIHDAVIARMREAKTSAEAELVAYAVEEAVIAGVIPRAVKTPKRLSDVRTAQDLVDVLTKIFTDGAKALLGARAMRFSAENLVDLTYGAATAAMARTETPATKAAAKEAAAPKAAAQQGELEFSQAAAQTTPASWDGLVRGSEIMKGKPSVVKRAFRGFMNSAAEIGYLDTIRKSVVDAAAPVAAKIDAAFDGKVRNALGELNPLGQYRQAQDYSKLLISFFELGALKKDGATNQYFATRASGVPSQLDVTKAVAAWGETQGLSFDDAYASVSKMLEAMRHKGLMEADPEYQPNKLSNNDPRPAKEQVAEGVRRYEATPAVQRISRMADAIRHRLIDQMQETGRLAPDEAQFWKTASGYVPFDRIEDFNAKFKSLRRAGRGLSQLGQLPAFVGSTTREVSNVLDNMSELNGWMVGQVIKQDANTVMLRELARLGYANPPVRADSHAAKAIPQSKRVKIYVAGVEHTVELLSQYDQAAFSEMPEVKGALMRAFGAFANVLRTTITAMPPFAAKQVTDDIQRAFFTSGVENPAALIIPSVRNFLQISVAELRGRRHQYVSDFGQKGLVGEFDFNSKDPAETFLQDFGFRQRGVVKTLLHRLEGVTRASDLAVRKAIYDQTMKETHDAALAMTRAREFINFRRRGAGAAIPALTSTIPFFGAYLQGTDVLLRAATGKDSSMASGRAHATSMFVSRALQMTAMSALYAMAMGDDDDYNDMDIHARSSNWVLPGGAKLSVPGELGALFKVPAEMALEFWRRQGTPEQMEASEAAITAINYAASQYVSRAAPIPAAVKPLIEAITNFSTFTMRPLLGAYHKGLEPSLQRAERTSELAIAVSEFSRDVVGVDAVSPILVDNFFQGYFGSVANLTQMMTDTLLNPGRVERPLHRYWMLSNYLYDPIGSRKLTEFYDLRERASKAKRSLAELVKSDPDRAEKYALDHESELALSAAVTGTLERLERTRAYKKYLSSDEAVQDLTSEERAYQMDETRRLEIGLVEWVREAKAEFGLR